MDFKPKTKKKANEIINNDKGVDSRKTKKKNLLATIYKTTIRTPKYIQ